MIVGWAAPASYGREGEATASRACRPDAAHVDDEPGTWPPSDLLMMLRDIPVNASHPKMHSDWRILDPEVMYWAPRHLQSIWGA
jgi:hypothetical protein